VCICGTVGEEKRQEPPARTVVRIPVVEFGIVREGQKSNVYAFTRVVKKNETLFYGLYEPAKFTHRRDSSISVPRSRRLELKKCPRNSKRL